MRHEREQPRPPSRVDEQGEVEPSFSETRLRAGSPSLRPRHSVRPSAFGPPLASQPPVGPVRASEPPRQAKSEADAGAAEHLDEPTPSGTRARVQRAPEPASESGPTFRADLEELLPFVATRSPLPRALSLPALSERPAPRAVDPRRTKLSLAIFAAMIAASAVPLLRYVDSTRAERAKVPAEERERRAAASATEAAVAGDIAAARAAAEPAAAAAREEAPEERVARALEAAEANLPPSPSDAADILMRDGLKALAAGDQVLAEALLGRALKHDADNPRAHYALARIRLAQGNLEGAEGWIVSAVRKRPRRAEYHALYGTILERLGRPEEAEKARSRARELRNERL
jgi:hypothetical protein